jgi:hypothetical protein
VTFERVWTLLHLFFAFGFVGTLVLADWNSRAARATADWGRRALLFEIVGRAARLAGAGTLILTGLVGNLLATRVGYRMSSDAWLRWANGLWLAAVLAQFAICLPAVRRIEEIARSAAGGGDGAGWDSSLKRWRLGNALLSVLYLGLLGFMVFRWRG